MAFKICKKGTCGLTVTDLNDEDYQIVSMINTSGLIYYTFEESSTINALVSISYNDERVIRATDITTHSVVVNDQTGETTNVTDESEFEFEVDGLHSIYHIIVPTAEYVEKYRSQLYTYFPNGVYFTDNGKVYFLNSDLEVEDAEIETLFDINTEGTTIIREEKNTFSLCNLEKCFAGICKALLSDLCPEKCDTRDKYSQQIYNRDLVWMAINVIKYCIELGQYYEAQRYLELINGCGEFCSQYMSANKVKGIGCGCSS